LGEVNRLTAMRRSKKPTIRQVAEAAGVSTTTVSFVVNGRLNGEDRISPETRQRVLSAIDALGYFPDQSAQNLRRRSTGRICLAVNDLGIPYNSLLAKEIYKFAEGLGYMTIIALMGSPNNEQKTLEQLMRGLADGAIFISPAHLTNDDFARLAKIGIAVAVSTNHLRPTGVDVIRNTEKEAAYEALHYLYERGHRRIGYIGGFSEKVMPLNRYEAYRQFIRDYALPIGEEYIQFDPGVSREQAYEKAKGLLALPQPPTAIYAGSDLAAFSAIYATYSTGLRVPEDVAVVGSGNIPEAAIFHPPLTTIGPPRFNFNPLIQFLFSRLDGQAPPEGRLDCIEWNLIVRQSA
jgi:DNA-binding LacI/PurR family transcriptional regulator